jgi:heme iron utilization protein
MTAPGKGPGRSVAGPVSVSDRLKALNSMERFGVLATLEEGKPYASLVAYALSPDLRAVVFATTKNTRKYKNIIKADQVALLIDNRSQESPITKAEAVTLTGRAKPLRKGRERAEMMSIYLDKHQDLTDFVQSPTTALVALRIDQAVYVSRFQEVTTWQPGEAK